MTTIPQTFDQWLDTDLGKEVYDRITRNRHAVHLQDYMATWETIEDIQQQALIYLWQKFELHGFSQIIESAHDDDHAAAMITKLCVTHSRSKYSRRRRTEQLIPEDSEPVLGDGSRATDNIRGMNHMDTYIDVKRAKEMAIAELVNNPTLRNRGKIAHRAETILFGYSHLANGRYGEMEDYFQQNEVTPQVSQRWRPRLFSHMSHSLTDYNSAAD